MMGMGHAAWFDHGHVHGLIGWVRRSARSGTDYNLSTRFLLATVGLVIAARGMVSVCTEPQFIASSYMYHNDLIDDVLKVGHKR